MRSTTAASQAARVPRAQPSAQENHSGPFLGPWIYDVGKPNYSGPGFVLHSGCVIIPPFREESGKGHVFVWLTDMMLLLNQCHCKTTTRHMA